MYFQNDLMINHLGLVHIIGCQTQYQKQPFLFFLAPGLCYTTALAYVLAAQRFKKKKD